MLNTLRQSGFFLSTFLLIFLCTPINAYSMFEQAKKVAVQGSELARIWPGFWTENQSFAVYDNKGKVYLFTSEKAPEGFALATNESENLYINTMEYFKSAGGYELNYDFGSIQAPAIRSVDGKFESNTLFHEAFHHYQHLAFKDTKTRYASQIEITSEMIALKYIEKHFLKQALLSVDEKQKEASIRIYTALRKKRQALESAALTSAQLAGERQEGVANYIGFALDAKLKGKDSRWVAKGLSSYLNHKSSSSTITDEYLNWDSYGIGGALTHFLMLKDPQSFKIITESLSPYEVLELSYPQAFSDESYKKFLESQGFEGIRGSMNKLMKGNEKLLKKYHRKKKFLLSIEFRDHNMGAFEAKNVMALGKSGFLVESPKEVSFVGPSITGRFSKYWYILVVETKKEGWNRLEIALPGEPSFDCNNELNHCKLEYGKLDLLVSNRYTIERHDDVMLIRVE